MITRSQHDLERKPATPRTISFSRGRCSGVTTIELIAVLAIIAILAGIVAYSVMKRISVAGANAETISLSTLAETYKTAVMRTRSVPNMTNWWTVLSDELTQSESDVLKNRKGNVRLMLPHPQARITNTVGSGNFVCNLAQDSGWQGSPVYQQNAFGALSLANLKIVFASSIGSPLVSTSQTTDFIKNSDDFDKIWNTSKDAIPNTTHFLNLSNKLNGGEDLVLLRLDLAPMFCRVVLNNMDDVNPWYSLDGSTNLDNPPMAKKVGVGIPPACQVCTWFIKGTTLDLRFPSTTGLPGNIQMSEVINESVSYVFEKGRWCRRAASAKDTKGNLSGFIGLVEDYLSVQKTNMTFVKGHTGDWSYPQDVVNDIYTFMIGYSDWAESGFQGQETSGSSATKAAPLELSIILNRIRLNYMVNDTTSK
jgi:type II secretory pathway pseudopilin PulG